jgi:hypothetical protein
VTSAGGVHRAGRNRGPYAGQGRCPGETAARRRDAPYSPHNERPSMRTPGPGSRPPTITDVTKLAEASRTMASHVLNEIGKADPRTREHAKQGAVDLGYRPNLRARDCDGRRPRPSGSPPRYRSRWPAGPHSSGSAWRPLPPRRTHCCTATAQASRPTRWAGRGFAAGPRGMPSGRGRRRRRYGSGCTPRVRTGRGVVAVGGRVGGFHAQPVGHGDFTGGAAGGLGAHQELDLAPDPDAVPVVLETLPRGTHVQMNAP